MKPIAAALALTACTQSTGMSASRSPILTAPPPAVSVADFGAVGDGATDDRAAIQAALSSGAAEVVLPDATYLVTNAPNQWWSLHVPAGVWLHGASRDGTVIRQAAPAVASGRVLYADGANSTISALTLDGDRAHQTIDEHRAGLFGAGPALAVRDVAAHDFTGDGFVVYYGADRSRWERVTAHDNTRNGITLDATDDDVAIVDSAFAGNGAQQVDSEPVSPSALTHVLISRNTIDGGATGNGYALTVVGASMTTPSSSWRVTDNKITGGVQIAWISDVTFAGNVVTAGGDTAALTVLRWTKDVLVAGNTLTYQGATDWRGAVYVTGTASAGQQPIALTVVGNAITNTHPKGYGLRVEGASDLAIVRNVIVGPGVAAPLSAGIRLRANNPAVDFVRATIADNTIRDFGESGVRVDGNGSARLDLLELARNTFSNVTGASMTHAAVLDADGSHALQRAYASGNVCMVGVSSPWSGAPAGSDVDW